MDVAGIGVLGLAVAFELLLLDVTTEDEGYFIFIKITNSKF